MDAAKVNVHVDTNYNSKQYLALPNEDAISQGGYSLLERALEPGLGERCSGMSGSGGATSPISSI